MPKILTSGSQRDERKTRKSKGRREFFGTGLNAAGRPSRVRD